MNLSLDSQRSIIDSKFQKSHSNINNYYDYPLSKNEVKKLSSFRNTSKGDLGNFENQINSEVLNNAEIEKQEELIRLYQIWPGKNRFLLWGRIIFGPSSDNCHLIITWTFVFIFSLLYYLFVSPFIFY